MTCDLPSTRKKRALGLLARLCQITVLLNLFFFVQKNPAANPDYTLKMLSKVMTRAESRATCVCVQFRANISFSAHRDPRVCFAFYSAADEFYFRLYVYLSSSRAVLGFYCLYRLTGLCLLAVEVAGEKWLFLVSQNWLFFLRSIFEIFFVLFLLSPFDDSQSCRCLSPLIKQDVNDIFKQKRVEGKWPSAR